MAVYKDKKNGKWYFRVYVTNPITNERIQKTKKGYELKRDAQEAEALFIKEYQNSGTTVSNLFFEKLTEEYIVFLKKRVKITTFVGYEYQIRRHILPFFENMKLKNITKENLNRWYNTIFELKYDYKYKNKLLQRINGIFEYISKQYDYKVKHIYSLVPFKKTFNNNERKIVVYDENMLQIFLSKTQNELEKTLFMTLFYTGTRISELRAIKWTDIDFTNYVISINKQVTSKVPGQGPLILSPKSESSIRQVQIPQLLIDQLKIWFDNKKNKRGFKEEWQVFGDFTFIPENSIRRWVKRICDESKLPYIKLHEFRHSYTTLLHSRNVDPKIIQLQAGHSSVNITLDVYTHIKEQQKKQSILDAFDNVGKGNK